MSTPEIGPAPRLLVVTGVADAIVAAVRSGRTRYAVTA